MCGRIYLDTYTSSAQVILTIQIIIFADFTYNSLANYLHIISQIFSAAAVAATRLEIEQPLKSVLKVCVDISEGKCP
jgi:hypothetical protein